MVVCGHCNGCIRTYRLQYLGVYDFSCCDVDNVQLYTETIRSIVFYTIKIILFIEIHLVVEKNIYTFAPDFFLRVGIRTYA